MLDALEQEYGVKPMIYTTCPVYYKYLERELELLVVTERTQ